MTDREKVLQALEHCDLCSDMPNCPGCAYLREPDCMEHLKRDIIALLKAQEPITGETSDGYHTFNELYHHRAVLFSVIVANYKDRAWKSVRHHDGTMYDGMFIVGINTPDGQATYHYDINPYWDMFDCKVREFAPKWDGHTPAQAIERIGKLKAQEPRVMTLEEAQSAYVIEYRSGNMREVGSAILDLNVDPLNAEYGKIYRVWTSRPTAEQREATLWRST